MKNTTAGSFNSRLFSERLNRRTLFQTQNGNQDDGRDQPLASEFS